MKPLMIELFCGSFGWSAGWLAQGGRAVGFDIEHLPHHGPVPKGAELVLQDVTTLHGSQFRDADLILASPPCQRYSYMAMPWKRAKAMAQCYRENIGDLNDLFNACFRIQLEASQAAGHHIPLVVENVKGARPWVGSAKANYGSYYLWGDVESVGGRIVAPGAGFGAAAVRAVARSVVKVDGFNFHQHLTNQRESDRVKQHLSGPAWFDEGAAHLSSKSIARKAASAMIARIPLELAAHIARIYRPAQEATA